MGPLKAALDCRIAQKERFQNKSSLWGGGCCWGWPAAGWEKGKLYIRGLELRRWWVSMLVTVKTSSSRKLTLGTWKNPTGIHEYIYLENQVYVPSLELGPPHPLSPYSEWDPPPGTKEGGHIRLRERGFGSPNSDDWRKCLALCLLSNTKPAKMNKQSYLMNSSPLPQVNTILL